MPAPESTARILSPASGGLNCTKGKVGPYVSVGVQQHRRHGPCCGRIDAHDKCCRQCNEPLVCTSHGLSPCTIHVGFPSRADSLAPAVASVWAAKTEETGHEQALEAGCVAFLRKPFEARQLIKAIKKAVP